MFQRYSDVLGGHLTVFIKLYTEAFVPAFGRSLEHQRQQQQKQRNDWRRSDCTTRVFARMTWQWDRWTVNTAGKGRENQPDLGVADKRPGARADQQIYFDLVVVRKEQELMAVFTAGPCASRVQGPSFAADSPPIPVRSREI